MLKVGSEEILRRYCEQHTFVAAIKEDLHNSVAMLFDCFTNNGMLYVCGNGGSCADADHIVGELVKAFRLHRPLPSALQESLKGQGSSEAALSQRLQDGLPAINLGAQTALMTAIINDVGGDDVFAQQVAVYGRKGDVLLGISTSGNSRDILAASAVARAKGLKTLGLTSRTGGKMSDTFDLVLHAQADATEDVQDQHSVIYHALCAAVEYQFWGK